MTRIDGSVGQDGDNMPGDVRLVQQLLNRQDLTPLRALEVDGRVGARTIESIRHFQTRYINLHSPDGRVDPDGKTFKRLTSGSTGRGKGSNAETRKADRTLRAEKVDPRVKEAGVTTRILDALVPRLANTRAKVISGYLSDSDLFWKVNYHWEYLLDMVVHSLTLPIEESYKRALASIRGNLDACPPWPASGYTSSPLGKPEDRSSMSELTRRHKLISSSKRSFRDVVVAADLKGKSKRSVQSFDLACAPVAHPGTSKHGTGYALDIQGDNGAIKSVCSGAGATLVFDEQSHVHVEFKNGVAG
jgi:peptidoglycan hydrolase-like protein with peptidoglycan-binding domain